MFQPADLNAAIIAAPMAGGPSTPALCASVTNAGGLGTLAGGYRSAGALAEQIAEARRLTPGPIGVNLFVPSDSPASHDRISDYAERLAPVAAALGVEVPEPRFGDDDGWQEKLDLLADTRPEFVSFTFGCPEAKILDRFAQLDVHTSVTVTTVAEAEQAAAAGAASVTLQGPGAGGHRGTFDQEALPETAPLIETLTAVVAMLDARDAPVPVIAAGGLCSPAGLDAVLFAGAQAAQLGTAFLLAEEAGTNPVHRAALRDPGFAEASLTRSFSGRWARGLQNEWMTALDPFAPAGYPEINSLTAPLRAAAVAQGNPRLASLWAGTGFREARIASAADIIAGLLPASRR